jgi:hypothetical protein
MSDEDYTEREYVVCVQQDVYSGSLSKRGTRARTYSTVFIRASVDLY